MRRLVTGNDDQNRWICFILAITIIVFSIVWYALSRDIHVVISHLLYIPVILACYRFPIPGLIFTLVIIGGYLGFEANISDNYQITLDALLRGVMIFIIGGVVTYLSLYLRFREKSYLRLLSNVDTGVLVTNKDGIILYANPYAHGVLDRRDSSVVGMSLENFAQDKKELADYLLSCLSSDTRASVTELNLKRKDGFFVPVMIVGYCEKQEDVILTITDLSEEKWMAHELATGKVVLKTLLDAISEGVFLSDTFGKIISINKSCREIAGWEEGMDISQKTGFFEDRVYEELKKAVSRCVLEKIPLTLYLDSDTSPSNRYYELILTPVPDDGGATTRVAGVIHDITDQENYLNKIKEREEYLRLVLDGLPLATIVIDPSHKVMSVNQALSMLFEQDVLNLIGTSDHGNLLYPAKERPMLADLLVNEDVDILLEENYGGLFSSSPTVPGAYEVIDFYPHIGDEGKWIRSTAARLVDENGVTIGAIETFEDFSTQKQAEEIIRISEERFKIASHIATDLIFEYEQVTDRISWFGDIEKWLGLESPGRVSTLTGWVTLIHQDDVDRIRNSFIQHVLSGDPISEELRIKHRNGQYQTWVIKAVALYNAQFQQIKTIGVVSDISEMRANEEAKKKALVAIEKYIEQFAILGDHIRNPLQVIAGYNDLQSGEYKEKIALQISHVNRIVDQLDRGWIESESIRDFLRRHYGISENEKF